MIAAKMHGNIKEFDERRGLGVVTGDGGEYRFHCTRIADGSRTIEPGTPVEFDVAPGPLGQWEAVGVRRVDNL